MGNSFNGNGSLINELCRFRSETVTIFTESGGLSGRGFTGVLMDVNCEFVTLMTRRGQAPETPFTGLEDDRRNSNGYDECCRRDDDDNRIFGSVCKIPIKQIVAFCHNAV